MATTYEMKPIDNGTRMRTGHSTFDAVITSYSRGQVVRGDAIWIAPADGSEVKKGDTWLHVTHVDGAAVIEQGWMAYIHKGYAICEDFKTIADGGTEEPAPVVEPINADVHVTIRDNVVTAVTVGGETWVKPA